MLTYHIRAYIAASRRSDRSLEARIESARRASEIHKKRTGRALRVTEQDVVNEEMYEEEDDDLPAQIRRLQSLNHLQTNSMDFNRRLQAYMTSQMGTRTALMEQSFPTPAYSNAPFFANQFAGAPQQPSMLPPQMLHYPNPGFQPMQYPTHSFAGPMGHHRSASMSTPQDMSPYLGSNPTTPITTEMQHHRRMSMPSQGAQAPQERPSASRTTSTVGQDGVVPSTPQFNAVSSPTHGTGFPAVTSVSSSQNMSFAPFSTSLPQETQQLLVSPASMGEAYTPSWASGNSPALSYSYKPNSSQMPGGQVTTMDTMFTMPAVDTNVDTSASDYAVSANTDYNCGFISDSMFSGSSKLGDMTRTSSSDTSGLVTPGNVEWHDFINGFDDTAAQ